MSRTPYSVLISGAGIAGPALAYWLSRANFEVTIVELAATLRPGGQAVDIRGAARDVVERMGLLPTIKAAGLDERGFAFVDERGKHQVSLPVNFMGGEGIVAEIEILRGALSRILHEATRDDTEYRFDDAIESLAQDEDGVQVTFVNGPSSRFDVVVGADGVHSRVRTLAFGEGESAWVAPLGGYIAYFTLPSRIETLDWFAIHNAPGGRAIGIRRGGPNTTQVMLSFLSPPLGYERQGALRQKEILRDIFAGVGWEGPRVLEEMWDAPDFYFDLVAQVRMERWTRGRVALLGDAVQRFHWGRAVHLQASTAALRPLWSPGNRFRCCDRGAVLTNVTGESRRSCCRPAPTAHAAQAGRDLPERPGADATRCTRGVLPALAGAENAPRDVGRQELMREHMLLPSPTLGQAVTTRFSAAAHSSFP